MRFAGLGLRVRMWDLDPLNKAPSKTARSRVKKGFRKGVSLILPGIIAFVPQRPLNNAGTLVPTTHRLHSSSFLGLPYRILNMNIKQELQWSLWVFGFNKETPKY